MKARIKFAKRGYMKFIGHLDIMRFFQKAIRRANLDIAYSAGFNPHQIMSFASPLGVGNTSEGEYIDVELRSVTTSQDMMSRLNQAMVEGLEILSFVGLEDKAKNAMSILAAADYRVTIKKEAIPENFAQKIAEFYNQTEILVQKKTKKSEKEVDIRPMILEMHIEDETITDTCSVFLRVLSGSSQNLKPDLVLEAFDSYFEIEHNPFVYEICRLEMYANTGTEEMPVYQPLSELGYEI